MREFDTGATRDEDKAKPDYEGYYHPLVVEEFGRYMTKHRIQKDGKTRNSDNWQQLFGSPEEHKKVCMKSLLRHVIDLWKFHRGHKGRETIKDALCAIIFNAQAYLFSILIREQACDECGGDAVSGHQRLCPTLYENMFLVENGMEDIAVHSSPVYCGEDTYMCEYSDCGDPATRQLMYLTEGKTVVTYRCSRHKTYLEKGGDE